MPQPKAIESFVKFFESYDVSDHQGFNQVYADDVQFVDPFHEMTGRETLYKYFQKLMKRVTECSFEIKDVSLGANGSATVVWVMSFRHSQVKKKEPLVVNGVTHLKFHDKVTYHRDYFDSSELIYKNIPILGSVIQFIEKRV